MRAAWLEGGALRYRTDAPPPRPAPGEARVLVHLAGICGTDLELLRGYRPFAGIPGHEFVGTVEEGPEAWRGRRVVAEINVTCAVAGPTCRACRAGRTSHCERRRVLGLYGRDGGFAERISVPVGNLHAVPETVPDRAAVFTEPLAAALRVLEQVEVGDATRALVVGPGRLGTLVARVLDAAGARVEVATRSTRSAGAARERGLAARPVEELPPAGWDLVVDCTGSPAGFDAARAAVRPGGTLVLKSTYAGELSLDASGLVVDEIRVIGSRCGPFHEALAALERGRIPVEDLIDATFPLSEAVAAFGHAARPGALKVLIEP